MLICSGGWHAGHAGHAGWAGAPRVAACSRAAAATHRFVVPANDAAQRLEHRRLVAAVVVQHKGVPRVPVHGMVACQPRRGGARVLWAGRPSTAGMRHTAAASAAAATAGRAVVALTAAAAAAAILERQPRAGASPRRRRVHGTRHPARAAHGNGCLGDRCPGAHCVAVHATEARLPPSSGDGPTTI